MAYRLAQSVVKGEIDNRIEGRVIGRVWLLGRDEPIQLDLEGNCLQDVAGHRFEFANHEPNPGNDVEGLAARQVGITGDITASRKCQAFDIPFKEAFQLRKEGKDVPMHMCNVLYLEWFSKQNGRVVIEMPDPEIRDLSEPVWRMSREEAIRQDEQNQFAMRDYMERVSAAMEDSEEPWEQQEDFEDDGPMDEFEWEQFLRESDQRTDRFSEVFEKYVDHPDAERLVAREMGWDWLDDALDADDRGLFEQEQQDSDSDFEPLEPNPLTEGQDWIRTADGRIKHPLSHRAFEVSMRMWHQCKDMGLLEDNGDNDVHEMLFRAQTLGAKLAGALDNLAYDDDPDPGFVIAYMKRGLPFFNESMAALERVRAKGVIKAEALEAFRRDMFDVRQEILNLMRRLRSLI